MRRLIINADDFGLTSGINRAVLEAHQHGLVTSTTLMACGAKFTEAAGMAAQAPRLSVGCHVVLVDGMPVLQASRISTLAIGRYPSRFGNSLKRFALLAAFNKLGPEQIEDEITAQVRKLQDAGIQVSHLDSHKHTHMFPVVLKGMLRAAKNCGVRAMRNPFEPLVFASVGQWKRQFQLRLLRRYRTSFQRALAEAGVVTPDGCIGIAATGGLTHDTFRRLIEHLPEGTWEFVSHPGYNDAELDTVHTRLRASREKELAILTSPDMKDLLKQHEIDLISYRDL